MNRNDLYVQFRLLFRELYDPLTKYAHTFVQDHTIAEDLVQDVFVRIWEKHQSDGAHRDIQLIKNFVARNWPDYTSKFAYEQTSISYNNLALSLVFLDGSRQWIQPICPELKVPG